MRSRYDDADAWPGGVDGRQGRAELLNRDGNGGVAIDAAAPDFTRSEFQLNLLTQSFLSFLSTFVV